MRKHLVMALVATALAVGPIERATAGSDFVPGLIIGGIAGAAINQEVNNRRQRQQQQYRQQRRSSTYYSATRAENREIQTSLNYFGFYAGAPDGVLGRQSRSAIAGYQRHMGYPVTGQLTSYEKNFLLSSYSRAQAGGANTAHQIASTPGGAGGLLLKWRDEQMGVGTSTASIPAAPETQAAVPAAPETPAPDSQMAAATPAIPNFLSGGSDGSERSLASHCNKVSLMTSTNGGFTTLATMTDSTTTLNEQFCLARTYAIATGEELVQKVQGFTPQQIAKQCKGLGDAMSDQVGSLAYAKPAAVLKQTNAFIKSSGTSPGQLQGMAKICLSVGYRTDNLPTALASALLLTATGDQPYAELLGDHLEFGFGTAQRDDLAKSWYDMAIQSLESGSTPVFAPGQPERVQLLKAAVFGRSATPPVVPTAQEPTKNKLPSFSVDN